MWDQTDSARNAEWYGTSQITQFIAVDAKYAWKDMIIIACGPASV